MARGGTSGYPLVYYRKEETNMHVYTRRGDGGETSLYSGERVSKANLRVEAYGTADELQSWLGLARTSVTDVEISTILYTVESQLIHAMAELATIGGEPRITVEHVAYLEENIDRYTPEKFSFRVPGDTVASAQLHVARTVARRCERVVQRLANQESLSETLMAFLNRISDLCYVLACAQEGEKNE